MSDTSLVFDLLGRDGVSRVLGVIRAAFSSTGRTAESAMDKASVSTARLDRQIEEVERDLAKLNAEFAATGDKTLFGKISRDRSLLTQLRRIREDIGRTNDEASRSDMGGFFARFREGASAISSTASTLGQFGGTLASATSSVWGIVAALGAAAAAAAALGPALAIAGGAVGSFAAITAGLAAGVGTLKLGLFGLGSEYKRLTTASGGGSGGAAAAAKDLTAANRAVEQAAKAVARAERDITDAQKDALAAQKAITEARETASDRIRDQALDLRSAQAEQKDAAEEVTNAQALLNQALANGDPIQIEKARDALDEAQIAAERATNRVDDLTEAVAKNGKTGVEGSDEVVQAKEREKDARQRVADAIDQEKEAEQRLADARKALADQASAGGGGGGGAAQQITKLAPAARAFLNTIIGLRPAFEDLRLDVQQQLFAGLSGKVQTLAERWLPQLHTTLGRFAGTFNGIARTFIDSASKKTFIDNMAAGAESARVALEKIGTAAAGPLVDAFGRLARASGPFLEKVGTLIAGVIEKFSAWIRKADDSGKLQSFFQSAATTLEKVWTVGSKVFGIVGQIIGIIWGRAKTGGDSALDSISNALTGISEWLDKPENQKKIMDLVNGFIDLGKKIGTVFTILFSPVDGNDSPLERGISYLGTINTLLGYAVGGLKRLQSAINWAGRAWDSFGSKFQGAYNAVTSKGAQLIGWARNLPKRISAATSGMWDGIKTAFKAAMNWVIGRLRSFSFTIGGGSFLGMELPSKTISPFKDVPYLAKGGNITRGGAAVVGDAGAEVLELPTGARVTPLAATNSMVGGDGGVIEIRFDFGDSEFGRMMVRALRTQPATVSGVRQHLKITTAGS